MFGHIVPCGIADKQVTSLVAEGCAATMSEAVDAVIAAARTPWGPVEDVQRVTHGATADQVGGGEVEPGPTVPPGTWARPVAVEFARGRAGGRALDRRLLRSGVDPGAGLALGERKPPWLRAKARMADDYLGLQHGLRDLDLITVCEEAGCPNIYECWSDGTATFMINGTRCTRACGFCQVDTRHPLPLDAGEPERVAEAVERMELAHAVITCVARDDLPDGGAGAFASTIAAVRRRAPQTVVEVLIADCKGDESSLQTVFGARPDVLNHNIETVARLQRAVRPSAGYARSLAVLARAKETGLTTKSGIILGMGEREDEVLSTLADLRGVGVDIVTLGQYLRPSSRHLPVARWWAPEEFDRLRDAGIAMGFAHVQASPLTRSSYHAREAAEASAPGATVAVGLPSDSAAVTAANSAS
jgi:lipoic acid synthetase